MGGRPRIVKQQRNRHLIRGTATHFTGLPKLDLGGRSLKPQEFVRLLQSQIDLLSEIATLEAARHDAIEKERALERTLGPMFEWCRFLVESTFGNEAKELADFGLEPRKKPGPKTAAVKAEGARKVRETRAARQTMGKRQRRKVKGGA